MKILMINVTCGSGSTGRICTDLAQELEKNGHEVKIAYGRDAVPEKFKKYAEILKDFSKDMELWKTCEEDDIADAERKYNQNALPEQIKKIRSEYAKKYVLVRENALTKVRNETKSIKQRNQGKFKPDFVDLELLKELNKIGGENGVGIADICENRVVGMKSRGVYETPGGTILMYAHRELEYLTLDKKTQAFNEVASNKFTELVYSGEWYTPLREALSAYFDKVNETTTGTVKLKLYKGNIIPAGTTSPYSLYNESIASFTTGDLYDHKDANGFINLFGLPLKVRAMMMQNAEKSNK